ncbi:putative membrane protein [Weissella uvarum]|uniref:hypothetical protein n=1 Tax=Weissella uvarum TaxID=1479233 RepID=UPI00195FA2A5|nr:hypothetical protein [Weissella uvarum]MBM7616911.1 putative membrane protein [Weissella uvarum]MCM0594638.1 hypothetical protein [Weissella uvarum]
MFNSARGTFLRASPRQLLYSLLIDILMYMLFSTMFKPMDATTKWMYIIFFPGLDFFSLVVSFYHYVKDYLDGQNNG